MDLSPHGAWLNTRSGGFTRGRRDCDRPHSGFRGGTRTYMVFALLRPNAGPYRGSGVRALVPVFGLQLTGMQRGIASLRLCVVPPMASRNHSPLASRVRGASVVNGGVSLTRGDAHSQSGSERLLRFVSRGEARDDDALPALSGTLAQRSHF